ncbi:sigma-54-dependent Fis family transcriptional regulator [Zoogloea oryzae]|uniref:Sigma-54-dependent Fis family transcriptional regulator n=1 Tax=Zoogloea oryzae TaxID=310767 RepID=A0ABQ6F6W7_9RHOO|nr:sigma-54-dependent Fis family transcriptional regulator [Zoogloea oryzae]GLT21295.1 sigma-54-dependent Fis family transcriptional regulator [Zoogloea oryzae]
MSTIRYPQDRDLRSLVRFCADKGMIWLDEHRMILMHAAAMSALRKELIDSLGIDQARRILTRMGYASGARDAELARKVRPGQRIEDAFVVGPQLHMLEGSVYVTPVALDMDVEAGTFYGEFLWDNSYEAEAHVGEYGHTEHPVCWMQIGYASGFTSAFMGRFILFREVECAATGQNQCRIVGKPVEEWPDAAEEASYYEADSILAHMLELRGQVDALRASLEHGQQPPNLIGSSSGFRHAYSLIDKAAATHVTVLLLGETGVGKERFARALHDMSRRAAAPFVAVNCAALPHELIESELFGVEKGAFTGAHASRAGKFERADGGTLFLDEVGELPLPAQAKLLRVLQEGEIERLGDERVRKINVRLVAATNVDLQAAVKAGRFRSDLFYRLNVYPVRIPPLRERVADIQPLVEAMVQRFSALHDKRVAGITDKALRALKSYAWPGNIRELENIIERGIILTPQNDWIEIEHLFTEPQDFGAVQHTINDAGSLADAECLKEALCRQILASGLGLDDLEEALIQHAVRESNGNLSGAARLLRITRPQLNYRLKKKEAAD